MDGLRTYLIGAGNVATHLALRLRECGAEVVGVFSRTALSARSLAERVGCEWTTQVDRVSPDADLYVYCVSDSALPTVAQSVVSTVSRAGNRRATHLHTAGSMPLGVLASAGAEHAAVLYPLQTFSRSRAVDFSRVPLFVEASDAEAREAVMRLAAVLGGPVREADSVQRARLHLAAVFACNFVNRMYALSADLLAQGGLPFDLLLPLIDETAQKVHSMPPLEAQTGPAVRFDRNVMDRQLSALEDEELRQIYELISRNIHRASTTDPSCSKQTK